MSLHRQVGENFDALVPQFDQEQFHQDQFAGQGSRERIFNSGASAGDASFRFRGLRMPNVRRFGGLTPTICRGNAVENSALPRGNLGVTPWKTRRYPAENSALPQGSVRKSIRYSLLQTIGAHQDASTSREYKCAGDNKFREVSNASNRRTATRGLGLT